MCSGGVTYGGNRVSAKKEETKQCLVPGRSLCIEDNEFKFTDAVRVSSYAYM